VINIKQNRNLFIFVCLSVWFSTPALAHRLQVFASADGVEIIGSAYFAGGAKASGVKIVIQDATGQSLATLTTAADGSFRYRAQTATDHLVVADSGDGHRAQWLVTAAELAAPDFKSPQPPFFKGGLDASFFKGGLSSPPLEKGGLGGIGGIDAAQLAAIEQAVARHIRPLREELQIAAGRAQFRDILGGIGYIFGFTGILLWWRSRKPPHS
jgi:nickel transport protein